MASSTTDGLVPITRASLARYYDKYPAPFLSEDIIGLTAELRSLSDNLLEQLPLTQGEQYVAEETFRNPPHKVDENLWKNREHIEEILYLLDKFQLQRLNNATDKDADVDKRVKDLQLPLQEALKALETFQSKNSDFVFNTVMTYMPQDFRGALIRQQRERSERNKQALVDALVNSGGSIHDRYALLWNQQMERRRQLAQLGSAQGVYKTVVKYLVGVPQVLLDFIKQINDDQGPMEEQRQRYGPSLYSLTKMVLSIRFFLQLSLGGLVKRELKKDQLSVVEKAVEVYTSELKKFIKFIRVVFENSPFFISAEDAGTAESRKSDDYKETVVAAGRTHEVTLTVESVNSYIAWDFSLTQGALNRETACVNSRVRKPRSPPPVISRFIVSLVDSAACSSVSVVSPSAVRKGNVCSRVSSGERFSCLRRRPNLGISVFPSRFLLSRFEYSGGLSCRIFFFKLT